MSDIVQRGGPSAPANSHVGRRWSSGTTSRSNESVTDCVSPEVG